ncbi:MAG TPA: hypothetical protein VHF02_10720 [Luteimonas sp.]|nr:hypothetical protein [Luteimonas sp.]
MATAKTTKPGAARAASKTLRSPDTAKASKSAAGSALAQSRSPGKDTGAKAAGAASKTLRDGRTATASKSAAGSALAQTGKAKGKR